MAMFWGIVLTIIVLVLSLITISKGYGFKHSVDDIDTIEEEQHEELQNNKESV